MFGFKIITEKEYLEYKRLLVKEQKFYRVRSWFSGWKDLEIIWTYIFEDVNFGGIEWARKEYAEARETDEYGKEKF